MPSSGAPAGNPGAAAPTSRGPSAEEYVELDWTHPVYTPEVVEGQSASLRVLSGVEALAYIAGDDPRPLLILRECKECNGTDKALLRGGVDNEKTALLARWFHCVKLPMNVREEDHPFYALFPEKDAEHLFVVTRDGSERIGLESEGSRKQLWDSMRAIVGKEYSKKANASLKKIAKLLDDLDVLDERRSLVMSRRDEILEEDGPEAPRLKKLTRDLLEVEEELAEAHAEIAKASELELKRPKVEDAAEDEATPATSG